MIAENQLDDLLLVICAENRGVLNYLAKNAWPTTLDATDEAAAKLFAELWAAHESILGTLVAQVAEAGVHPTTDGTYGLVTGRFNFARFSHILQVIAPVMAEENAGIASVLARMGDTVGSDTVSRLAEQKTLAYERVVELAAVQAEALLAGAVSDADAGESDAPAGEIDWHDADVELEDRMAAVSGGSKRDQLWAAMAQTDCTACGYDCEGYADAIHSGDETDLTKCVPGEDATADVIKTIMSV